MNRKRIVIAIIIITVTITGILLAIISPSNNQSASNTPKLTIAPGLEDVSATAKAAAEAYITQDNQESITDRNNRLEPYFAPNSPVYDNQYPEQDSDIVAVKTSIISIKTYEKEDPEASDGVVINTTNNMYDSATSYKTVDKTYLLAITKQENGKWIATNIGEWSE
ncbi:MAG: hypothetical protein WCP11_00485 [Candidatus Saccharibacteria bacterium]